MNKTINIKVSNSFTKEIFLKIRMPYLSFFSQEGFYDNIVSIIDQTYPSYVERNLIKYTVGIEAIKTDRINILFEKGVVLDIPYDVTAYDAKIISHYLKGIEMALKQ